VAVGAQSYLTALTALIEHVATTQQEAVRQAAALITTSLRNNGVVQAFGTGHSEALAMEIAGRAGGLVPTNRIALRDLVLYGDADRSVLDDPLLERRPGIAHRLYELAPVRPDDVFVVASNSGVNGAIVEFAHIVKEHGHPLIAITSLRHSAGVPARHPSGRRLADLADVVLDNGAPYGDAVLDAGGTAVCAISSITAALLAQMVIAEVVRTMLAAGETPPVYLSANIPEGDAHNSALEARYAGRIRRSA
jgi:uncharacterized phosphosugar-binding protein